MHTEFTNSEGADTRRAVLEEAQKMIKAELRNSEHQHVYRVFEVIDLQVKNATRSWMSNQEVAMLLAMLSDHYGHLAEQYAGNGPIESLEAWQNGLSETLVEVTWYVVAAMEELGYGTLGDSREFTNTIIAACNDFEAKFDKSNVSVDVYDAWSDFADKLIADMLEQEIIGPAEEQQQPELIAYSKRLDGKPDTKCETCGMIHGDTVALNPTAEESLVVAPADAKEHLQAILDEVNEEIEQRKHSGNDEDYADLERKALAASTALAKLVTLPESDEFARDVVKFEIIPNVEKWRPRDLPIVLRCIAAALIAAAKEPEAADGK